MPKAPDRPPVQDLFDLHVGRGWTVSRIAKHYWTSPETVKKWLEETGIGASVRIPAHKRTDLVRSKVLRVEQRSMETRGVVHHYEVLVLDCGHLKRHQSFRASGNPGLVQPPHTTKCPTCTHRKAQEDGRQGPEASER